MENIIESFNYFLFPLNTNFSDNINTEKVEYISPIDSLLSPEVVEYFIYDKIAVKKEECSIKQIIELNKTNNKIKYL